MSRHASQGQKRWPLIYTLVLMVLACTACSSTLLPPISHPLAPSAQKLPGEEIWRSGISSFLFGTNDTFEWAQQNLETQPAIQQDLRTAGFTIIRSFFQDNAGDAAIEQRITAIENSGAHCLGVIFNIFDVAYDEHLVQYLGKRCLMYEFGNEPDYNGISVATYLKQWNAVIPLLRHINPDAAFIGPVASSSSGSFIQDFLSGVKSSGVLPDAISFHWYPCYQNAEAVCLHMADTAGQAALQVRDLVKNILGKDLPIGITEWNFDPGNPPPSYGDTSAFMTSFSTAALASMIQAGVAFACQFDAASFAGSGHLDMFDVGNNAPKPQYYAIKSMIDMYRPSS
jgi:hypothetical protein